MAGVRVISSAYIWGKAKPSFALKLGVAPQSWAFRMAITNRRAIKLLAVIVSKYLILT